MKTLADNLEDARTLDISNLPGILGDLEVIKKEFAIDLKSSLIKEDIWSEKDHILNYE